MNATKYAEVKKALAAKKQQTIRIETATGIHTFVKGTRKQVKIGDGMIMETGKVKLADGTLHHAILELCPSDGGEHWGTGIWIDDGLTFQDDPDFLDKLSKSRDQVFPYRYKRDYPTASDHHTNAKGWSR